MASAQEQQATSLPAVVPGATQQQEQEEEATVVWCCQKCRCALFTREQLSRQHAEGRHAFAYRRALKGADAGGAPSEARECGSVFVSEPNSWMLASTAAETESGKLNCPKCGTRVGTFAWSGSQCSCGTWIVPALQFPASKLDPRHVPVSRLPEHLLMPPETVAAEQAADPGAAAAAAAAVSAAAVPAAWPAAGADADASASDLGSEAESDAEEKQHESPPQDALSTEEEQRVASHLAWLSATVAGDVEALVRVVDPDECSVTTVQKRCFEGPQAVAQALGASGKALAGRLAVVRGPVALAAPSTSTRVVFRVAGVEGEVGETLVWGPSGKLQHCIRVKAPSRLFLTGAA
jgi:dual specificity phosphatase 12